MPRYENETSTDYPMVTKLEVGTYSWCACGKTHNVPWCDGSHAGTGIEPVEFEIKEPVTQAVCNCGLTSTPPFCDGSHVSIE